MTTETRRNLSSSSLLRAITLAAAVLVAGLAGPARAQSPASPPSGDGWEFTLAPYLMGASLDGTAVVKGRQADVDVSASDIFDHMDLGVMGMLAARKGDWGLVGDAVYVDLNVASEMPPADFNPSIGLYSIEGVRKLNDFADVTLGVRWNRVKGRIAFKPPIDVEVERTRKWFDPVVGVVLRTPAVSRVHGTLIADVGGFGVGSDVTWQVFPSVGVRLSKHASIEAGWRFLSTDYKTGEGADRFEYDILYQGPVVGFAFRF